MPNYNFYCECGHIQDAIISYENSLIDGFIKCDKCSKPMKKYFGKGMPMTIVPIGTTGNAENGYTSVSNVQKDRNGI